MKSRTTSALVCVVAWVLVLGCSSTTEIPTPEKIGEKDRVNLITGAKAAAVVNRLHRNNVATGGDVIAEYGRTKKDLLYISAYPDGKKAKNAFDLMINKMRAARGGPFSHLMPIKKYGGKVYMTLGMGAVHYIIWSENHLLWLQTYQSFGNTLPPRLLELYSV